MLNTRNLKWSRCLPIAAAACLVFVSAVVADAAIIAELESDGSASNNTQLTAQAIADGDFTLPVPATVFDPPGYRTATIEGAGGVDDVDFFSFMAAGGDVYFDIDNDPFTIDLRLSLFDSSGTLIAYGDDSSPADDGSASSLDAFLGVFTLPAAGTYFIAVSEATNAASATGGAFFTTDLFRPDGAPGGTAVDALLSPNDSSFARSGTQVGLDYTLHISLQNPGAVAVVPEPGSMIIWAGGGICLALAAHRRRHRQRRQAAQ